MDNAPDSNLIHGVAFIILRRISLKFQLMKLEIPRILIPPCFLGKGVVILIICPSNVAPDCSKHIFPHTKCVSRELNFRRKFLMESSRKAAHRKLRAKFSGQQIIGKS
uniref:Uncharacterized protein n=1 Tax=Cacopsylla melanoneura TaxID=428564 RepID=A0A8D8ZCU2_9HEMI